METVSPPAPPALIRHRGLVARTVLVSGLTLVSRLLGFAREALMAAVFGERSLVSDAFLTAWRFPNLFRRLLGEGALSVSLQAEMTRADLQHGDAAGRALFLATLRLMTVILVAVTALVTAAMLLAPDAMPFTGWAWLGPEPAVVRDLTVRVLPYVVFVCVAALCGGALAVRGHFALPNLAPTAMNLVWIGALLLIALSSGWGREVGDSPGEVLSNQWRLAQWLAWGLLLGGFVQVLVHVPPLGRFGLIGSTGAERADAWRVLRTTTPLVLGAAIYQINVMVDGLMAESLLGPGGPSALYYANRVQQFPLALVSTAAISAVFPALNAHGHLGERARVRELHDRTQLGILFLALPAATGLFALALPIASVCYEHGNYGAEGTARVAEGLRCLAFALVPAGATSLSARVFVALGDLRTPVRIAAWMLVLNIALNAAGVAGLGLDVAGLTLSTAVVSWINLAWHARRMRTSLGLPPGEPGLRARVGKIALAAALSALAAWTTHSLVTGGLIEGEPRRSIPAVFLALGVAVVTYAAAAHGLAVEEWGELVRRMRAGAGGRG